MGDKPTRAISATTPMPVGCFTPAWRSPQQSPSLTSLNSMSSRRKSASCVKDCKDGDGMQTVPAFTFAHSLTSPPSLSQDAVPPSLNSLNSSFSVHLADFQD